MSSGEGLVALLYAVKGIFEAGVIWVLTAFAVLAFFWIIIKFIAGKAGIGGHGGGWGSQGIKSKEIMYAIFILMVIFGIYSLIGLTGAIFGVNSSPVGGIYRN